VRRLHELEPNIAIVVLTIHRDAEIAAEALRASEELITAITRAAEGVSTPPLSPQTTQNKRRNPLLPILQNKLFLAGFARARGAAWDGRRLGRRTRCCGKNAPPVLSARAA